MTACPVCGTENSSCAGHVAVDMSKVLEEDVVRAVESSKTFRLPQQTVRPGRGVPGYRAVHESVEVYDPETGKTVKVLKAKTPSEER